MTERTIWARSRDFIGSFAILLSALFYLPRDYLQVKYRLRHRGGDGGLRAPSVSKRHPVNVNLEYLSRRIVVAAHLGDFMHVNRSRRFVRAMAYITRMTCALDSLLNISKFYYRGCPCYSLVLDTHPDVLSTFAMIL